MTPGCTSGLTPHVRDNKKLENQVIPCVLCDVQKGLLLENVLLCLTQIFADFLYRVEKILLFLSSMSIYFVFLNIVKY
jgi:hypothetical protein